MVKKKIVQDPMSLKFKEFTDVFVETLKENVKRFSIPADVMRFDEQTTYDGDTQEVLCVFVATPGDGSPFDVAICKCIYPLKVGDIVEDAKYIAMLLSWEMMDIWGWDGIMAEFLDAELF